MCALSGAGGACASPLHARNLRTSPENASNLRLYGGEERFELAVPVLRLQDDSWLRRFRNSCSRFSADAEDRPHRSDTNLGGLHHQYVGFRFWLSTASC